jgi:hypothetical protein
MAFTRLNFDENAYKQELYESTETGRYQLLDKSTHRGNDTCFQETPEIRSNNRQYKISTRDDMVNAESDLFNIIRKDSKDPRTKFPYVKPEYDNLPKIASCNKTDLSRVYPLLDGNQFNRSKQIQVQRFESLCLNPQQMSRIRSNNYVGLNTRLYNRDYHRPTIPSPDVVGPKDYPDQTKSLNYVSPIEKQLGRYNTLVAQADAIKAEGKNDGKIKEGFQNGGCGCLGGATRR